MSKFYQALTERVNRKDILDWADGTSGLLAVTKERVYIVRTPGWESRRLRLMKCEVSRLFKFGSPED